MANGPIDIVITWVDGSDPVWRAEKKKYKKMLEKDPSDEADSNVRYRDWDNLQYIFRGIEKFMPWVRTVYLVTWGHVPKWLNASCDKLRIVNHQDFIPAEYLPTFNSNTIELNLHRIPGIAEQFINFNDDMFVVRPTKDTDFFVNGLPKDFACISPQPIQRDIIANIELNNIMIINDHFKMSDILSNKNKWINVKYGKYNLRSIIFSKFSTIIGIFEPHVPFGHLKSTMIEVWDKERHVLHKTCTNKFRASDDCNEWLFRSWQLASGKFIPRSYKFGTYCSVADSLALMKVLGPSRTASLVCLNDSNLVTEFEKTRDNVNSLLNRLFPDKSSFEI